MCLTRTVPTSELEGIPPTVSRVEVGVVVDQLDLDVVAPLHIFLELRPAQGVGVLEPVTGLRSELGWCYRIYSIECRRAV